MSERTQAEVDEEFGRLTRNPAADASGRFIAAVTVLAVVWFLLLAAAWGAYDIGSRIFG